MNAERRHAGTRAGACLLTVTLRVEGLRIADLRPHATDWPVMQLLRYASTQALAADLLGHGFDGAI